MLVIIKNNHEAEVINLLNNRIVSLYSSDGLIRDLIRIYLSDNIVYNNNLIDISNRYKRSLEDTDVIAYDDIA